MLISIILGLLIAAVLGLIIRGIIGFINLLNLLDSGSCHFEITSETQGKEDEQ